MKLEVLEAALAADRVELQRVREAAEDIERTRSAIVDSALVGPRPIRTTQDRDAAVDQLAPRDAALARQWREHGPGALVVWDASDPAGDAVTDARPASGTSA